MSFAGIVREFGQRSGRFPLLLRPPRDRGRPPDSAQVEHLTVTADDGVGLHVEVRGAVDAPVTLVFCHGYLLNSTSWHVQRATLADRARVVLWDLRGHGRSGWGSPPNATIDQLGRDLFAVLEKTAPVGPVVLVGHSMGGMAILGLAESHPELFGDYVTGVFLASTSAGELSSVTVGLPARTARLLHRMVPVTLSTLRHQARLVDTARRPLGGISFLLTWPYLFGSHVPRPVAEVTIRLMASVPIQVIADFYDELIGFDKRSALPTLGRVPVHIVVGGRDLITPVSHSEALAAEIPGAELEVVPGAGHLLILERPVEVNQHLWTLLCRAADVEPDVVPVLDCAEPADREPRGSALTGHR